MDNNFSEGYVVSIFGVEVILTLKVEAACSPETSVFTYKATWWYNPEHYNISLSLCIFPYNF
jgi:hypothetical protein